MAKDEKEPQTMAPEDAGEEEEEEKDLYKILGLSSREATPEEIRRAYRKRALRYHPDKISSTRTEEEKQQARHMFHQVGLAYKILSDPQLRLRYDSTGNSDDTPFLDGLHDQDSWAAYFKDLWAGEVNAQTIDEFANKYRGSEEELQDLRSHYLEFDGSLEEILSHTMCATEECEPRLIERIDGMIKEGVIPAKAGWERGKKDTKGRAKRRRQAAKEAQEAEALAKELGVHEKLFPTKTQSTNQDGEPDTTSLQALIRANAADKHDALIARLEAKARADSGSRRASKKTAQPNPKKRKATSTSSATPAETPSADSSTQEPSEDQFQKIQAALLANKKSKQRAPDSSSQNRPSSSSSKKKKS